ncbi:MAG: hypothetical protein WBB69_03115 [Anaerolineales bacterium]
MKVKKPQMLRSRRETGTIQTGSYKREFFHRSSKIYITMIMIMKT